MARDEELFKKADQALRKHNLDYAIELILRRPIKWGIRAVCVLEALVRLRD